MEELTARDIMDAVQMAMSGQVPWDQGLLAGSRIAGDESYDDSGISRIHVEMAGGESDGLGFTLSVTMDLSGG